MPGTKYVNKVIYGGRTLIDLTGDTISADKLLTGITAHDKSGAPITGSCPFDVDSTDATAAVAEILAGKTAYARGQKLTGTMPNKGSTNLDITTADQEVSTGLPRRRRKGPYRLRRGGEAYRQQHPGGHHHPGRPWYDVGLREYEASDQERHPDHFATGDHA